MIRKLSSFLDIEPTALEAKGVFDAFIGVDTRLFVDPHLLKTTRIPEFADSYKKIEKYYEDILTLLQATERRGDRAWREAFKRLVFREMSGIAIGYGENTDAGSGVGPKLAGMLIESAQEIIRLGIRDPEIFALIGLFEPGFGADRLSDMTIRIIRDDILAYTEMVSRELKVKRVGKMTVRGETYSVPYFDENKPLLFIPSEFLRSLPVALSWEEIGHVSSVNEELRDRLNSLIAQVWDKGKKAAKPDIKSIVLKHKENIEALLDAYKKSEAGAYDLEKDPEGRVNWSKYGPEFANEYPIELSLPKRPTLDDVEKVVIAIVRQFKRNIEVNGLKEHLYRKEGIRLKPMHERFAQLLFYSVADTYCIANDLDLSREPNAGSGPIDFKVASGYGSKVLVEIKLTSNKNLLSGMTEQLNAYQESENADRSIYLVIRVTESDYSIKQLQALRDKLVAEGKQLPKIYFVDATIKPTASKRKRPR